MYVWMLLATFIVALASFNLAPRSDTRARQLEPLAEASITKFSIQHDAAVRYAKAQKNALTLAQGEINKSEFDEYLPMGFIWKQGEYTSKIYCLNKGEYTDKTNDDGSLILDENGSPVQDVTRAPAIAESGNCNDLALSANYVVTYGKVPERWKNLVTKTILADYLNALKSRIAVGSSCGILAPRRNGEDKTNILDSDYILVGLSAFNDSVPPYVLDQDENFKNRCGLGVSDSNFPKDGNYCIVYVKEL